ncbi:MAG: NAD(P)-binding domain-containing protein [Pseudomonadota bacterium]
MRTITTVIIGAGHAGLAMSRCLAERSIDHVVLERGEVANTWRTERWDSLRLLTPNWQRRLPGLGDEGGDPDGYATMAETVAFIDRYAQHITAPVETGTNVISVRRTETGYLVVTDRVDWHCKTLVIATGACNLPSVPRLVNALPGSIDTVTPLGYRNPDQLRDGGVLVVGAAASGVQLANEIQRSGRPVTLSTGEHIRAPRLYRGRDIQWWMDAAGVLDQHYSQVDDIERARRVPSLQLVGSPERETIDLNALQATGVKVVGRLVGINDTKLQFSGSLRNHCALSDLKLGRLLDTIDAWATMNGLDGEVGAPYRLPPTTVDENPALALDLASSGIQTVLWATGYRPDYSWLHVPVFNRKGGLRHDGGVVDAPGLYVLGLQFLRRRKSALIDGAGDDANALSNHLAAFLDGVAVPPEQRLAS